jgi:hypothetical protein
MHRLLVTSMDLKMMMVTFTTTFSEVMRSYKIVVILRFPQRCTALQVLTNQLTPSRRVALRRVVSGHGPNLF